MDNEYKEKHKKNQRKELHALHKELSSIKIHDKKDLDISKMRDIDIKNFNVVISKIETLEKLLSIHLDKIVHLEYELGLLKKIRN